MPPECHIQGVWSILPIPSAATEKVTKNHNAEFLNGESLGVPGTSVPAAKAAHIVSFRNDAGSAERATERAPLRRRRSDERDCPGTILGVGVHLATYVPKCTAHP